MTTSRTRRSRALAAAVTGLLAATVLAACTTDTPGGTTTTPAPTTAGSAAFPVTIDHVFGSTTIDTQPQRVAAISWANQDAALALGVVPVAMPFAAYGGDADGLLPWVKDALTGLGAQTPALLDEADGFDYDGLAKAAPDLVLGVYGGFEKADYDKLSKVARTVAYPGAAWGTSWQDQLTTTGKALGREAKATEVKAQIEKKIADAVAANPQIQGKSFAYLSFTSSDPSSVYYYTASDARVQFVKALGMVDAPKITELSQGTDDFFGTLSAELVDEIDADVVLAYVDDAAHLEAVTKDPLLGKIPAIQRGSVVVLDDPTFNLSTSAPSPLSVPWAIDAYVPKLVEAVGKL